MNSDWRTVTLGEVAEIVGGGTPSTKRPENYGGDIPWITPKDLSNHNFRYVTHGGRSITEEGLASSSAKLLPKNTVLFTSRAPIGYVAIAKNDITTNQGFKSLLLKGGNVPEFFYYLLRHRTPRIESFASGSTFKEVSGGVLKSIEVNIPDVENQKAIAHILGTLDDKIELNQKMNQTLEEIAKAIFKSWFVDFDPVRAKAEGRPTGLPPEISDLFPDELVDSEIGEIPKGWKLSTLSEVFEIQGGSQPPAKTFIDDEKEGYVRLLQIRDYDNAKHKTYVPAKKNLRLVDEDDVLIGRYGSGNGKFMEDSLGRPLRGLSGAINVAVVRTIPKLENSREFIATMISSGLFYKWIVGGSARAVQAGFKKDDLDYINLSVPSPEILSVYENFGALIWARTKTFREENRILSELRDTLLPKLISGELRIPDAEKFLAEAGI